MQLYLASRSQLNISDVNQAFRNRHIKLQELHDYLKQVQSFPPQKPVLFFRMIYRVVGNNW